MKTAMKKAKTQLARRKKTAAKKNMDTFFLRSRVTGSLIPTQGVAVANYVSLFFKLLDAGSAVGVTQSTEFLLFKNIYDQVRINRMTVKVIPKANTLDQVQAQDEGAVNVSGDGKVHTCVLRDDSNYAANVARFVRQPSYKAYSVLKPFIRSYSVKWPTGVWLDTQTIYSDTTLLQRLGTFGGVGIYAENLIEENGEIFNEPWAALEITYDCVFRGKTGSSLSYDAETGEVCVAAPTAFVNPTPSGIVALSGTVTDSVVTGFDGDGKIVEAEKTDSTPPA